MPGFVLCLAVQYTIYSSSVIVWEELMLSLLLYQWAGGNEISAQRKQTKLCNISKYGHFMLIFSKQTSRFPPPPPKSRSQEYIYSETWMYKIHRALLGSLQEEEKRNWHFFRLIALHGLLNINILLRALVVANTQPVRIQTCHFSYFMKSGPCGLPSPQPNGQHTCVQVVVKRSCATFSLSHSEWCKPGVTPLKSGEIHQGKSLEDTNGAGKNFQRPT